MVFVKGIFKGLALVLGIGLINIVGGLFAIPSLFRSMQLAEKISNWIWNNV